MSSISPRNNHRPSHGQQKQDRSTSSKYISYLLRHDKRIGELVDEQGFISIDILNRIIEQDRKQMVTEDELIKMATDQSTKKRFECQRRRISSNDDRGGMVESIDNRCDDNSGQTILFIRALNGHSFELKSNIFEPFRLRPNDDVSSSSNGGVEEEGGSSTFLFHVTNHRVVDRILNEGLKPMTRQFVHLYERKELCFFDGKRNTLLQIGPINRDTIEEMKLYRSKNGYVMCPNVISPKYIHLVGDGHR